MDASDIPYFIPQPWSSSSLGNAQIPIPSTPQPNNRASWPTGFPVVTAENEISGGIPPEYEDFQGALYILSAWSQWFSAGGGIPVYNASFQTTIGGYFSGAVVQSATTPGLCWRCTANRNMSNPDTGGANWVSFFPAVPSGANPTAVAGPTAVNGTSSSFMRADASPAVQQGSNTQKGIVQVDGTSITASAGVISATPTTVPTSANPSATAGQSAVNGTSPHFMTADSAPALQVATNSLLGICRPDNSTISVVGGILTALSGLSGNNAQNGHLAIPVISISTTIYFQWGVGTAPPGTPPLSVHVNFDVAFPNACWSVVTAGVTTTPGSATTSYDNLSNSGMDLWTNGGGGERITYFAIGW